MATLGNSGAPAGGYVYNDYGSGIQYWTPFTMPAGGGVVSDVYVYIGGDGVSFTGDLCIWGASALLWSGSITFPSDPRTSNAQSWLHLTVPSVYVPAGTVNLGVWAGGNIVTTQETSGTTYRANTSVGSPSALGATTSAFNALAAYITYQPAGVWISPSGTVKPPVNIWIAPSGTVEQVVAVYVNKGGVVTRIW